MHLYKAIRYIGATAAVIAGLSACTKKYPGDTYDFSDKTKQYIRLTAGPLIEINAETVDTLVIDGTDTIECYYHIPDEEPALAKVETREGLPMNVAYIIEYKSPSRTATLNGTHPKFSLSSSTQFTVEDEDFTEDEIEGTLTLKSVTGHDLTIGYPLEGNGASVKFVAYKPYVVHEY